ncbi:hypothetical protein D3C71_1893690 [compost metagenome]
MRLVPALLPCLSRQLLRPYGMLGKKHFDPVRAGNLYNIVTNGVQILLHLADRVTQIIWMERYIIDLVT